MEFLEGEELRTVLKREKSAPARARRPHARQVAIGLDEAHRRQLVHRDLKPDNLFLCGTREGDIVKILDFGSVKDKNRWRKKLTVLGTTIGSPFYMAPEQAQGLDTLDARADVWALAAIAYECLTGNVPFQGSTGPAFFSRSSPKIRCRRRRRAKAAGTDPSRDRRPDGGRRSPRIRTSARRPVGELADCPRSCLRAYGRSPRVGGHSARAVLGQRSRPSCRVMLAAQPARRA